MNDITANLQESVLDVNFWRGLNSKLNISDNLLPEAFELSSQDKQIQQSNILIEGYTHLINPGLQTSYTNNKEAILTIAEMGLPPVFCFVYDEFWTIRAQLRNILKLLLHEDYQQLPDFWAWKVSPNEAGWPPHRDKSPAALLPDNKPKSVTVWIPLTNASPVNSCMYVLPANRDKAYYSQDQKKGGLPGRLNDIRALPASPGDVLIWNQNLLHWGSHSAAEHKLDPRINVAYEFQRGDVTPLNTPLINPHTLPSFELRLALIARQIIQYTHMYEYSDELIAIAKIIETQGIPSK